MLFKNDLETFLRRGMFSLLEYFSVMGHFPPLISDLNSPFMVLFHHISIIHEYYPIMLSLILLPLEDEKIHFIYIYAQLIHNVVLVSGIP